MRRRTLLLATAALCGGAAPLAPLGAGQAVAQPANAQRQDAYRILVFSRTAGFRHDSIPDGIAAIRTAATAHGVAVEQTEDAAVFEAAQLAMYGAIVFLSTTGDFLPADRQAALQAYIEAGGGFVGIHAAADAEYDWPWYGGLVGTYFDQHPEIQTARIHIEDAFDPSTVELPDPWTRTDEWYSFRANPRAAGVHVLLTLDEASYHGGTMGADHPIAWYHDYDGGRAWYTAGGHTSESYSDPLFMAHVWSGIEYAAGQAALRR